MDDVLSHRQESGSLHNDDGAARNGPRCACPPPAGQLGAFGNLNISIGILAASLLGLTDLSWRALSLCALAPALLGAVATLAVLPEVS